jgi:hypothetical protein
MENTIMDKIRSGQSFLYREGGLPSMIIEARMKDTVQGNSLKQALTLALVRYPYLSYKMVENGSEFYLAQNPLPFIVEETTKFHSLGNKDINYHLIDITYSGKNISIAYQHGLCDGRGIMPFVSTLLYYYCTNHYKKHFAADGIRLAGEPLLPGETADPCAANLQTGETQIPRVHTDGFALPDAIASLGQSEYFRYEVKIRHGSFMQFVKANNSTPAIAMALLLAKAIKAVYPSAKEPVVCNLAVDLRHGIHLDNTFKDCVGSVNLPYTAEMEDLPFSEQSAVYKKLVKEYKDEDNLKQEINKQVYLYEKLDALHSVAERKQMLSFLNNFIANTFIVSYVGQTKLGECEKHVDSLQTYTSGTKGLSMQIMSVGSSVTVNFMQSFRTDTFIKAFAQNMDEAGFEFSVSEIIETSSIPKDSIQQ